VGELRYRVIHGYRRAYRLVGSGPALLLVHGISDHSGTWTHLLPELAKRYTVIAPDLLGHGGSDKPRADYAAAAYACGMRDLLGVLDIEQVTVVGHSLGGGVAMQFAYQFPERCERLVLLASGGIGRGVHPLLRLASAPGAELALPLLTRLPGMPTLLPMLDFGPDAKYARERYEALRDPATRTAFLRTLRSVVDVRGQVVTMLDRCYLTRGIPTLLVWGSADRIVPVGHAHKAHKAMPGSRLEIFTGAGHFPHQTDPRRFVALLDDFIASTPPAEHDPANWRILLRDGPDEVPLSSGS
jgi:pimeloyl-ACP methyl ester carboxylesterase